MRLSPVLPSSSCAAAGRCFPHRSPALLGRCPAATAPPSATVSGPRPRLHFNSNSHCKLSRFVSTRCSGGNASSASENGGERGRMQPADAGAANGGAAEGGSSSQLLNAAEGGRSTSQHPNDADARPADAKASRQQQAAEVVLPLLQEALRPLVEAQTDMREVLELQGTVLQQQAGAMKALMEQQLFQHEAEQQQHAEHAHDVLNALYALDRTARSKYPKTEAIVVPSEQVVRPEPRLLDYVYVGSKVGVVLGSAEHGTALKMWTVSGTGTRETLVNHQDLRFWTARKCDLQEQDLALYKRLPYDPKRKGVPVTRFTAAPGMLVRRGYHTSTRRAAEADEVGVLQPSPDMGDTCLVEWASGSQGVYATGKDDRFELVHLETSRTSGAPVVGQCWTGDTEHQHVSATERGKGAVLLWGGSELQRPDHLVVPEDLSGHPVERGTHWTYGGAEPGVGLTRGAATVGQKGPHNLLGYFFASPSPTGYWLPVQWPNGQTVRHRASPVDGYDLCYSARPGDSVTFYTARQGLRVEKEFGGEQGVLVRPDAVDSDGVRWLVVFDGSPAVRYCDVRGSSTFVTFTDEDDGDVYDLELRYA